MNFKTYIAVGLLAGLSLTSCSNFLDKMPEGSMPSQEVDYSNMANLYAPASGMYAISRTKLSQWEVWPLLNVRGDEVTKGGASDNDQYPYLQVERFEYDAIRGFWALDNAWIALYNIVYKSYDNMVLLNRFREHIVKDSDAQRADMYEAEIRFHRAFAYFMLQNMWGEVPIITADNLLEVAIPKSRIEKVRAFIHQELDYCIEKLPALRPNERTDAPGAVTKYTALALKAKLALYEKDYALAQQLSDEVISSGRFTLYTDFYQLFKIPGKLCNESLYELQFSDFGQGSGDQVYGGAWFEHQGPREGIVPIAGWGFMAMEKSYVEFLESRGETSRLNGSLLASGATTPSGDFVPKSLHDHYNGKAYTPANQMTEGRPNYGANNNIRMMRYADVLLINAEARIMQGQSGDEQINLVRQRAGLTPIAGATLEQLLDERRAEFSMEWGDRFYDLVRTGKAAQVLPGFQAGTHDYLPIPQNQEDLNPMLGQPAI